jgi:hypothetical protein
LFGFTDVDIDIALRSAESVAMWHHALPGVTYTDVTGVTHIRPDP